MNTTQKSARLALVLLLALMMSGCFAVRIMKNVKNPDRFFDDAYRRIESVHEADPDRYGRPHKVYVLVYDKEEWQLIKVDLPYWLLDAGMGIGEWAAEKREDFDYEERYDFDWREFKELRYIGPGLVVDIEDEDSKILVWLE